MVISQGFSRSYSLHSFVNQAKRQSKYVSPMTTSRCDELMMSWDESWLGCDETLTWWVGDRKKEEFFINRLCTWQSLSPNFYITQNTKVRFWWLTTWSKVQNNGNILLTRRFAVFLLRFVRWEVSLCTSQSDAHLASLFKWTKVMRTRRTQSVSCKASLLRTFHNLVKIADSAKWHLKSDIFLFHIHFFWTGNETH